MTRVLRIQNRIAWAVVGALCLLVIAMLAGLVNAGPLDPPAPPGSTQETQINSLPYTISTSGSYIFTRELTGSPGSDGITVTAPNATIDMRGFALVGPGGAGTERGIVAAGGAAHLSVRDGIIHQWGGFGLQSSVPGEFANLTFDHDGFNSSSGVLVTGAAVSDCVVNNSGNSPAAGLAASNSSVMRCQFTSNPGIGLNLSAGSTATNVTATGNGLAGILASNGSTVADSTASSNTGDGVVVFSKNTIARTTASSNGLNGINVTGGGNNISDNDAAFNTLDGIRLTGSDNSVTSNNTSGNGGTGAGGFPNGNGIESLTGARNTIDGNTSGNNAFYGIYSTGNDAAITGNHTAGNHTALGCAEIWVTGSGARTLVADNSAQNSSGCGLIYLDAPNITAYRNNSRGGGGYTVTLACTLCDIGLIGTAVASTSPWANIAE